MAHLRRSILFVPADKPERIEKAATLSSDVVVIELEDGVSPENKDFARKEAGRMIEQVDFGSKEVALRVNRISTLNGLEDMQAMAKWARKPDLVLLPKVESAGEVRIYDDLISQMKAELEFMVMIESSRGILNAAKIVSASPRVSCLALGLADLSAELGSRMSWDAMFAHRAAMVLACGLTGIMPIDSPYLNIMDETGLLKECKKVREMGYSGKLCIHPAQLAPVNEAFTPSSEEVAHSRRIVRAAETQGTGALVLDGKMVDTPVIKSAQRIVEAAERLDMD